MIFRKETAGTPKRWPVYASAAGFVLFFFGLVMRHMQDLRFGVYFVAAMSALILSAALFTRLLLGILKRLSIRRMTVRQAVKGLFRQGNATRAIMVTLTASLSVIFAIYLIEQNLDRSYVQSYPADAPNLFVLDIQPSQREAFAALVGQPLTFYPVVRAQVTAVNDTPIDRRAEQAQRRDNLARTFNLTYRQTLLDDEKIIKGGRLFREDWTGPQVSVMDTVVEMHPMHVGDTVRFNIQGVPLTARISSIRTRTTDSLKPFFYFVFEEKTRPGRLFAKPHRQSLSQHQRHRSVGHHQGLCAHHAAAFHDRARIQHPQHGGRDSDPDQRGVRDPCRENHRIGLL